MKPRKRDRLGWALYRKGNFENLIENISDLTTNLVDLFPSTVDSQKELCKSEVNGLGGGSLALLDKAIGEEDSILKSIILDEVRQRPNIFSNIEVLDNFRGHFGDNVAAGENSRSGIYTRLKAGGSAVVHFGSNIGNVEDKVLSEWTKNVRSTPDAGEQRK